MCMKAKLSYEISYAIAGLKNNHPDSIVEANFTFSETSDSSAESFEYHVLAYKNQYSHNHHVDINNSVANTSWGISTEYKCMIKDAIINFDAKPARLRGIIREKIMCMTGNKEDSNKRLKSLPSLRQIQNVKKSMGKRDDSQVKDEMGLEKWCDIYSFTFSTILFLLYLRFLFLKVQAAYG